MLKHTKTLTIVLAALTLAACSGARQLYSLAETIPDHARVVLIHHNALGTEVANLLDDPEVRAETKDNLVAAYRGTVCSADERSLNVATADCREGVVPVLSTAAQAYEQVQDASSALELELALRQAVAAIEVVINAIGG